MKQFAVFRQPNSILVGVESATFNVAQLGERYGQGVYDIARFEDGKEIARYHQVVGPTLGTPKNTEEIPESALPSAPKC